MQAQKGRTKSALLIWTKSDLSLAVTLQYGPDLVLGNSDLVRFSPTSSDLVIRVTDCGVCVMISVARAVISYTASSHLVAKVMLINARKLDPRGGIILNKCYTTATGTNSYS